MKRWQKITVALYWLATPMIVAGVAQIVSGLPFTLTNGTVADATQVMADFNQIVNNVNANGAKNGVNSDITALTALATPLTAAQGGSTVFIANATTGGSANAQTIAATTPSNFALTSGYTVSFLPGFTNTAATTLTVNATAAKNVFKPSSGGVTALTGGEIVSGQATTAIYDGTQYVLQELPVQEQINAQTGVTYTYLSSDHTKLVTASNAAAQAYTLPQASATFPAGWFVDTYNKSTNQAGIVTITPTTSTIDGAATLVLNPGGAARIVSDGTNYQVANRQGLLQVTTQVFSASGTYNRRPGLVYAIVECWGPGASGTGGTGAAGTINMGAGGGSGGYSRAIASSATIGASQVVTIGAGGVAPAAGNTGGAAGSSSTSFGAICVAISGTGGTAGSGNVPGTGGNGAIAGTGNMVAGVGMSGFAGFGASIATINGSTAPGGSTSIGRGGGQVGITGGGAVTGQAASGFGGGGGGGGANNSATTFAGGNGGGGYIIVTEFSTQ